MYDEVLTKKAADLIPSFERFEGYYLAEFNDRLFLGQLASFEDIPVQKIDFLHNSVERQDVERFLEEIVRTFEV